MLFPRMKVTPSQAAALTSFGGLDLRGGAAEGTFRHMENMTAADWPALSVRAPRGTVAVLDAPNGLTAKDAPVWVDGTALYINGLSAGLTLTDSPKQLVSMGSYLLIWPDKVYINTADWSDCGSMEHTVTLTGGVSFAPCAADGTALSYTTAAAPPEDASQGALWLDTAATPPILRQYGVGGWETAAGACLRLCAVGVDSGFSAGDAVELSGFTAGVLNGSFPVLSAQEDALILSAPPVSGTQSGTVTLARTVPDMDFVVECGNRLWGCKYGLVGGESVNEIYASKLGDFKNWHCFAGLSTDSYAASRGSDGVFTGAAVVLGSPVFFKEECMERVYPAASGAHRIVTLACQGIRKGSGASAAAVNGVLYYHAPGGVYAYSGSMPVCVSQALGQETYHGAVGGALGGEYYVSMADSRGAYHLFCYDTARKLWHRQDDTRAVAFAACDGELLCLDGDSGAVLALHGRAGTPESTVSWEAQSGDWWMKEAHSSTLRRLTIRARLAPEAVMHAELSYDGGVTWLPQGTVTGGGTEIERRTVHVRPRRCRQVRLRLRGTGQVTVYSVTALRGKESETP